MKNIERSIALILGVMAIIAVVTFMLTRLILGPVPKGHRGPVTGVAFSPDNKYVLTGGRDRTARLWDEATGELIRVYEGHTESITDLAFSPDGKSILTASYDRTARLWEVNTGQVIRTLADTSTIISVAFSPDGNYILTGNTDQVVELWEVGSGQVIRTYTDRLADIHRYVNGVAFSPDGTKILTETDNGIAKLWDLKTGQVLQIYVAPVPTSQFAANGVAFLPDGKSVLVGVSDANPQVSDSQSSKDTRIFNKNVRIYSIATGLETNSFTLQEPDFTGLGGLSIALSPQNSLVALHTETQLTLWSIPKHEIVYRFASKSFQAPVKFSPTGNYVLTGEDDGTARMWDVNTGEMVRVFVGMP